MASEFMPRKVSIRFNKLGLAATHGCAHLGGFAQENWSILFLSVVLEICHLVHCEDAGSVSGGDLENQNSDSPLRVLALFGTFIAWK